MSTHSTNFFKKNTFKYIYFGHRHRFYKKKLSRYEAIYMFSPSSTKVKHNITKQFITRVPGV